MKSVNPFQRIVRMSMLLFVYVFVSCEDSNNLEVTAVGINNRIDLSDFRIASADATRYLINHAGDYVGHVASYRYANIEKMVLGTMNVFTGETSARVADSELNSDASMQQLAHEVAKRLPEQGEYDFLPSDLTRVYPELNGLYPVEAMDILDAFFAEMYDVQTAADSQAAYERVITAIRKNTTLNLEQRTLLTAHAESVNEAVKQLLTGGIEIMINGVSTRVNVTPVNGRASGQNCTLRVRDALRSGLSQGVVGAVTGAGIGAAGGTVVVPGLGTATGALNGGVVGFALGFAGGTYRNLVEQAIWGCLFNSASVIRPTLSLCDTPGYNTNFCSENGPEYVVDFYGFRK